VIFPLPIPLVTDTMRLHPLFITAVMVGAINTVVILDMAVTADIAVTEAATIVREFTLCGVKYNTITFPNIRS